MMKAAVMQPYLFPYIGYFQLLAHVDVFVFFDDVQFPRRGWVHRNRIRSQSRWKWLTLPVEHRPIDTRINESVYVADGETRQRFTDEIRASYHRAKHYGAFASLVETALVTYPANVAEFNILTVTSVARALGIRTKVLRASTFDLPPEMRGQDRILEICRRLGADTYVNAIGGTDLYAPGDFSAHGLRLQFIRTSTSPKMFENGSSHLSILDDLFVDGAADTTTRLKHHDVIAPPHELE